MNLIQTILSLFESHFLQMLTHINQYFTHKNRAEECYLGWKAKTQSWEVSEPRFVTVSLPWCKCVCYTFNCTKTGFPKAPRLTGHKSLKILSEWQKKALSYSKDTTAKGKMKTFWPIEQNWLKRKLLSLYRGGAGEYIRLAIKCLNTGTFLTWKSVGSILFPSTIFKIFKYLNANKL